MKINIYLIIIFILAIIIPSAVLGTLAFRASSHEEAFLEKEMKTLYSRELFQLSNVIREELLKIENELDQIINLSQNKNDTAVFKKWEKDSLLIKMPYHLSKNFEILYPVYSESSGRDEIAFLNWNKDFLRGKTATPVFTNILFAYEMDIKQSNDEKEDKVVVQKDKKIESINKRERKDFSKAAPNDFSEKEGYLNRNLYEQQALESLSENKALKEKIYKKAEEEGKNIELRNVNAKVQPQIKEKSLFVSGLLKFQDIIIDKQRGLIPRIINDKQELLFWKKTKENEVIGCLLSRDELDKRFMSILSALNYKDRFITILDESGKVLYLPSDGKKNNLIFPFVSVEVSEILPRWELAVYLDNPDFIKSRALFLKTVIVLLIVIMFLVILSGSILIIRSLQYEINLASQKTTFAANVSHELKTPLTSIRMFTEMLQSNQKLSTVKKNKYFDIMVSETERLTKLINNVLDFSKLNENKIKYDKKKIELCGLVKNIFEENKVNLFKKGFKYNFKCIESGVYIFADPDAVKQAVLNLLSNAEKYSSLDKEIEINLLTEKDYALIKVLDRGIGIDQKYARKIFKEFFRIDDSLTKKSTGTGLGLAIADKIIREHNGRIIYKARDGGGSIFVVKLPLLRNCV